MQNNYQDPKNTQSYEDFLASNDGKIFKQVISEAVLRRLEGKPGLSILDAGCGPGWLSKILMTRGHKIEACDISPLLIAKAKTDYPEINFQLCDLTQALPYQDGEFDCVVMSLSALDLGNQRAAYSEIKRVMKDRGRLIIITVNPYHGFPVGVWKRGFLGWLVRHKPALKLRSYFDFARKADRSFRWNDKKLTSYFYTLPEQINLLINIGFALRYLADITAPEDDKKYSLRYRLYRFPIFILMEFLKS